MTWPSSLSLKDKNKQTRNKPFLVRPTVALEPMTKYCQMTFNIKTLKLSNKSRKLWHLNTHFKSLGFDHSCPSNTPRIPTGLLTLASRPRPSLTLRALHANDRKGPSVLPWQDTRIPNSWGWRRPPHSLRSRGGIPCNPQASGGDRELALGQSFLLPQKEKLIF